jgi:hypothetical protein
MKKGEHQAVQAFLDRVWRIVNLAKSAPDPPSGRITAGLFTRATGACHATICRDIAFINSHSEIFGGKLVWNQERRSYYFLKLPDDRSGDSINRHFLESHVHISHYGVSDEVWDRVRSAITGGKKLRFNYHDIKQLRHEDCVEMSPGWIRLEKDGWFLLDADGGREWNMRFMFDCLTF